MADIRAWEERLRQVEMELEAGRAANWRGVEESVGEIEEMMSDDRFALHGGDPRLLRAALRRSVARVEVRTTALPIGRGRHSYRLAGGRIVFK